MSGVSSPLNGFQSTLSVRRATVLLVYARIRIGISIHALRKESDDWGTGLAELLKISIHALRKESDAPFSTICATESVFQSTLSVRRATTVASFDLSAAKEISIHALRKESDRAAGHFCPLSETQASCLALSISNNTTGTTNNMPKTSSCLSVSF